MWAFAAGLHDPGHNVAASLHHAEHDGLVILALV
jgi:hypothetical protein